MDASLILNKEQKLIRLSSWIKCSDIFFKNLKYKCHCIILNFLYSWIKVILRAKKLKMCTFVARNYAVGPDSQPVYHQNRGNVAKYRDVAQEKQMGKITLSTLKQKHCGKSFFCNSTICSRTTKRRKQKKKNGNQKVKLKIKWNRNSTKWNWKDTKQKQRN